MFDIIKIRNLNAIVKINNLHLLQYKTGEKLWIFMKN